MKKDINVINPRKIILFPFSGGSKDSYNQLLTISPDISVLEYPGRGLRVKEPLNSDIHILVDDLLSRVKEEISDYNEYIIYGHSLGALIGYLVCKKIHDLRLKLPAKLVVSGCRSPKYPRKKRISDLPDDEFWEEILKFGGIPNGLNKYPAFVRFYLPILKADFKYFEDYEFDDKAEKMPIPIDIFYGSQEEFTFQEINDWQLVTTGKIEIKKMEGNHFFIFNHKEFFSEYFNKLQLNATI